MGSLVQFQQSHAEDRIRDLGSSFHMKTNVPALIWAYIFLYVSGSSPDSPAEGVLKSPQRGNRPIGRTTANQAVFPPSGGKKTVALRLRYVRKDPGHRVLP